MKNYVLRVRDLLEIYAWDSLLFIEKSYKKLPFFYKKDGSYA